MSYWHPITPPMLQDSRIIDNFIQSLIFIICIMAIRAIILRALHHSKVPTESTLEWHTYLKSLSHLIAFIGVIMIWASELQTFALSLVAIAVALVIATKELILCLMGGILKSMSRPFKVGDRIEVGSYRGDVMDHDFFTTSIFEVGPGKNTHHYTGKRVKIPNSLFLNAGVYNETKRFHYGLHTFTVALPVAFDIAAHKKILLQAATEVVKSYQEQASQYIEKWRETKGVSTPNPEPRISVSFPNGSQVDLTVTTPIPSLKSAKIEQAIIDRYLELRHHLLTSSS